MKFLIINPFGIGDVLFTTPVIRALKEKYPDSFIGYWCNERVGGLLKSDPNINKIFDLSRGDIKRIYSGLKGINKGLKGFVALLNLIRKIKKEKFDVAFDFSLDSRYGLWSKLAGIKKRIGFNYKGRGRFLTDKIDLKGYSDKHVVEYYADLLKFIEPWCRAHLSVPYNLSLTVAKEKGSQAKNKLVGLDIKSFDTVVGIAMGGGASWGKDALYKQWPAKKFGELADRLIRDSNTCIVLLGSSDEKPLADIVGKMGNDNKRMIDLTGKLSLEELAAIMKELKLLICNDGGPLHMAIALGISTISIFGPVDERVYGPYPTCEKHIVVKKDISCRPCYKDFRFKGCLNSRRCLEDITVDEVYDKVNTLL
jgi:lipopolysaccharide heptosyltransferase II